MQRFLGDRMYPWIEYSLGKCVTPTMLEDWDSGITPFASRLHFRCFHDSLKEQPLQQQQDSDEEDVKPTQEQAQVSQVPAPNSNDLSANPTI